MAYKNPQAFFDRWNNKSTDVDGFYGAQCWDGFARFVIDMGCNCSTYCSLTGYAGDLYKLRYEYGYDKYFDFYKPEHAQRGDWIFWDRHVAMVWDVYSDGRILCFGQNQDGKKYFTLKTYDSKTALGCMRWKGWNMDGWKFIDGKWYYYEDGNKVTGWKKLSWSKGQDWFFFDKDGAMVTGWKQIKYQGKECWFWFDSNGAMATGFRKILWKNSDHWFLFDKDGVMQTGSHKMKLNFNKSGELTGGSL